jgi:hypothetical protein
MSSTTQPQGLRITKLGKIILAIMTVVVLSLIGLGAANAATLTTVPLSSQPAGDVHACVLPNGHLDFLQFRPANYGKCTSGDAAWQWARTDGTAQTPAKLSSSTTMLNANTAVPAGGSFYSNAVELGSITLHAGTYLITTNVKATPNAASTDQVFPMVALYNTTKNADFDGDVANYTSAFETGAFHNIDTSIGGSVQVTITQDTTYHLYGFGYTNTQGTSTWTASNSSMIQVMSVANGS